MTTLTEFLLTRLIEEQRQAEALAVTMQSKTFTAPAALVNVGAVVNPARVLAECEAKRRIVALHDEEREHSCPTEDDSSEYFGYMLGWAEGHNEPQRCTTLRALALPYADHEQYDESWRP